MVAATVVIAVTVMARLHFRGGGRGGGCGGGRGSGAGTVEGKAAAVTEARNATVPDNVHVGRGYGNGHGHDMYGDGG